MEAQNQGCLAHAVLLGPVRAVSYFFMHGLLAVFLGALWHWKAHWSISLATGTIIRLIGTLGYFFVTSWTLNEDLFSLLLANVYSLLVKLSSYLLHLAAPKCQTTECELCVSTYAFPQLKHITAVDKASLLSMSFNSSKLAVSQLIWHTG